jgi:hypothetical protein
MELIQLMEQLIDHGRHWVLEQRNRFRDRGHELQEGALSTLAKFIDYHLLKQVRIVHVPAIENPGFLEQYRSLFEQKAIPLLDFSVMSGITFMDTILLVNRFLDNLEGLLFHELVHVVQYDILGVDKFVELFLTGWVNQGFNYAAIPLEMDAYELQYRYESNPALPFSVSEEVNDRLLLFLDE